MKVTSLIEATGADFFAGVPDSQLRALCDYLIDKYGIDPKHHIIAANEGNAAALAAGYHFATGKIPVVYMQNSGEGNVINPVASLMNDKVYGIPCVFIIGWRGEPGIHDEPQHIYQGEVTRQLLEDMHHGPVVFCAGRVCLNDVLTVISGKYGNRRYVEGAQLHQKRFRHVRQTAQYLGRSSGQEHKMLAGLEVHHQFFA